MTKTVCTDNSQRASALSKRELRTLAKRLAASERPELRAVARALDKAIAGEPFGARHHDHQGDDYDPWRCARCTPDLWVIYAISVAFERITDDDFGLLAGLHGLSDEDVGAVLFQIQCGESVPPNLRYDWLAIVDRQQDEIETMRAELEPGCWYRDDHHGRWVRDYDNPDPVHDPEIEALLASVRASQIKEMHAFFLERSPCAGYLAPDPSLIEEIRFGSDPRKARSARRASLRKGFDPLWLI